MTAGDVSHDVLLERITANGRALAKQEQVLSDMRHTQINQSTILALATDTMPRQDKSIDALWAFVREREGLYPTMATFEKTLSVIEALDKRVDKLVEDAARREGESIGSQKAYEGLKSKSQVALKALGWIAGTGVGLGVTLKSLQLVISWLL